MEKFFFGRIFTSQYQHWGYVTPNNVLWSNWTIECIYGNIVSEEIFSEILTLFLDLDHAKYIEKYKRENETDFGNS